MPMTRKGPKDVEGVSDGRGRISLLKCVEGGMVKGVCTSVPKKKVFARRSGTVKIEDVINKVLNAR